MKPKSLCFFTFNKIEFDRIFIRINHTYILHKVDVQTKMSQSFNTYRNIFFLKFIIIQIKSIHTNNIYQS